MRALSLLLIIAACVALPSRASANSCNAFSPFRLSPHEAPASCKLVVHVPDNYDFPTMNLQTEKDGVDGSFDAPFTRTPLELDVRFVVWDEVNGECVESAYTEKRTYWRYELDVSTVPVGTEVRTLGGAVKISAEGTCTEAEPPFLYCQEPIQDGCLDTNPGHNEDDEKTGGCSAGGGLGSGGAALALLTFALACRCRSRRS
jgi:hypothetical protein